MSDESVTEGNTDTGAETQTTEATTDDGGTILTSGDTSQDQAGDGQDGDKSTDGGGNDEQGESAPSAPETYEFTMPEGVELDQGMADAVTPVFKDLGLSQEQADRLTGVYAEAMQKQAEAYQASVAEQVESWANELRSDKELGGDAFGENAGIARAAIEKLGSPELSALLDETGLGNHPELFRFALNVGKHLVEDKPGSGSQASRARELPDYVKLYPDMPTQNERL